MADMLFWCRELNLHFSVKFQPGGGMNSIMKASHKYVDSVCVRHVCLNCLLSILYYCKYCNKYYLVYS